MVERLEELSPITRENSNFIIEETVFNLWLSLWEWPEEVKWYFEKFSDLYYISCDSKDIDKWKNYTGIYEILQRFAYKAGSRPLEILIWKYGEESTNSKPYQYIVWFSGWSLGRASKDIINKIREIIPDKITELRCK